MDLPAGGSHVEFDVFKGAALQPRSPEPSEHGDVRYLDLRKRDARDEARLARPGEAGDGMA